MRFKGDVIAEYRRGEDTLRLAGKSTAGVDAKVEIRVASPRDFMLFLGQTFQAGLKDALRETKNIIPVGGMELGVGRDAATDAPSLAYFRMLVGGFPMEFGAPLDHLETDKVLAIERCFRELSQLLQIPAAMRN